MTAALGALQTAIWGILTFSILVVLHEMGHFLAARAFGVKIHEFMIGLPGPAVRVHTRSMDWGVTAVPLGGYVRIAGMEPGPEDELLGPALVAVRDAGVIDAAMLAKALGIATDRASAILASLFEWKALAEDGETGYRLAIDGPVEELDAQALYERARSGTYRGQKTWKRITILAMGVITNLVVAILTFTVVLSIWGYYDLTTTVDSVSPNSPAAAAGIQVGDTLIAVDGKTFADWTRFQMIMAGTAPDQRVDITYSRAGTERDVRITLTGKDGHGFLGVGPRAVEVHPNVFESVRQSFGYVGMVLDAIMSLFDPRTFSVTIKSFTGVVGVSVMAEEAARAGALSYASLIAMLSLSLGLMNILPLPPLDGGKILLELVERLIGRPLSRAVQLGFSAVGAAVLFSLIGYIMYLDILRYAT